MLVQSIKIKHFRNIDYGEIFPDEGLNFFIGKNAQGKTSLLEAIHLLSCLKSFRTHEKSDLLQLGTTQGEIEAGATEGEYHSNFKVKILSQTNQRKTLLAQINQTSYPSALGYLRARFKMPGMGFHCVAFNPSNHDLIKGEPRVRRQYLDQVIASVDEVFLKAAKEYQQALLQRNTLLKTYPETKRLEPWNQILVENGAIIFRKRFVLLKELLPHLRSLLLRLAPIQSEVEFYIEAPWFFGPNSKHFPGQEDAPPIEEIERIFMIKLHENPLLEQRIGTTLFGPHRDNWGVQMGVSPLSAVGSQGEIRTVVLGLKISEAAWYEEQVGMRPLLLVDDFSSELDHERREVLLQFLESRGLQAFITSTERAPYPGKIFEVTQGTFKESSYDRIPSSFRQDRIHS